MTQKEEFERYVTPVIGLISESDKKYRHGLKKVMRAYDLCSAHYEARIKELEDAIVTIKEDLEYANNRGWISDTIWHSETETLFDFIDYQIGKALTDKG